MERFRSTATAWTLAMFIIAGLSICCCTGKTLSAVLSHVSLVSLSEPASSMANAPEDAHSCCASDLDRDSSSGSDHDSPPCHCDHHQQVKKLPDIQTGIEFAAAPVLMTSPAVLAEDSAPQRVAPIVSAAVAPRPPTTLLRLRCALII